MATERFDANVQILGVKQTIRAMKEFEPQIRLRMNQEIRRSLQVVRDRAAGKYPKGKWDVRVTQKNMLGTIVAASGGGTTAKRWGDASPGVKAAIFEFAGSVGDGETNQAAGLIESLTRRYGTPGRFLWAAWDESATQVLGEITAAVRRAERDLQGKLDAAGEDF